MNLDSYFQRIGYVGGHAPNQQTLQGIVWAHATSIPFENLDVLLGYGVSLEPGELFDKLVVRRRGGYCFEHGGLLLEILRQLNFQVTPLSARVRYLQPRETTPPRTHLFLRVDLDGSAWMVDVGIGGVASPSILRLDQLDCDQETTHDVRRIVDAGESFPKYLQQVRFGDEWVDVSEFSLEEMPAIDQCVANWWTSTQPTSRFRTNLIVALANPDGSRHNLLNRQYLHRRQDQVIERIEINDLDQLLQLLWYRYRLDMSGEEPDRLVRLLVDPPE